MVFEELFGKCRMKSITRYQVCLLLCCSLLILYAGCATTREQEVRGQLDAAIEWELNQENKSPQRDGVLVALYLDAEEVENSTSISKYRCYSVGRGGYSGVHRVPFGTPWSRWERVYTNDFKKKIVIDPGPPYKNVTKIVNLMPGEVTNLGRIVLEKVEAEGTASISGIIKDEEGELLEGAEVSSNKGVTTTNSEGHYRIDGFGLEVCDLEVTKKGYIPSKTKVSIRDMDKRIIEQDFVLSVPRRVRLRYVISPKEKDDFNGPEASGGTASFFIGERYAPISVDEIKSDDFRQFINQVRLSFRIDDGKLTLRNFRAPIFYERLRSSWTEFKAISSVGALSYNQQHCPAIEEGDIILINGGKVSDYTVKIVFEEIQKQ